MSVPTNETNSEKTETAPTDHRVVVFGVPDENTPLKNVLIDVAGMDAATAQVTTRSLPGLLPGALSQHQAASVAASIREIGLSAVAVPALEVPNLSQATQIHHVRVGDGSVEIIDTSDQHYSVASESIQVISVGVVPSTAPGHRRPASSLAMGSSHHSWNDGAHVPPRKRPEAFIVLSTGSVLLLASDEMNYEYLGNRKSTSSNANFARLISDLTELAESAWVTPSTRALLDRGPVRHFEFRSRDDFRGYTEFQTLLRGQLGQQR
ncbi:MAG: hypothetical protein WBH28_15145 [Fuerstiella sp.]